MKMNESINNCFEKVNFTNIIDFFECYKHYFNENMIVSILALILIIGTIVLNLIVIILIIKNSTKLTIFDQILIGHSIVDFLTGLIDIPFYHIFIIFGYWPFSDMSARLWSSYDNSINTITNLHMLYLSWSRLRCIQNPRTYHNEFLLKRPYLIMLFIWLMGFSIWTPLVFVYDVEFSSLRVKYLFNLEKFLFSFFFWFSPLLGIPIVSGIIFYHLKKQQNRKIQLRNICFETNKCLFELLFNYRMHSKSVFGLMMSAYLFQWTIPCLVKLFASLIASKGLNSLFTNIYWLTFTVCLTDPIILLIFNPNLSIIKAKHSILTASQFATVTVITVSTYI